MAEKIEYAKLTRYTVVKGDSEFSIAEHFKVSVGALREVNSRSAGNYLKPGRKIYLPLEK
ncbi:LysM peptidoglycan-binding domain-containing protein [Levilactobacillus andaensis]|uniref:LysM peptidoglycan-binding domain-containing protein n=1 Tax=Levilactobacillus andaensis TaxID=2799570 RepID=UPI001941C020|nr:LysM domain-containing protein [Levilactobacillus andaensis]